MIPCLYWLCLLSAGDELRDVGHTNTNKTHKVGIRMFYDSHCHLDMLSKPELAQALTCAKKKGVGKMISCSTSFASNERNLEIATLHPQVKAALGLYPIDALGFNEEQLTRAFDFFEKNIARKEVVAVGEVGLDYKLCVNKEEQEKQVRLFRKFIALSNESKKPIVVHSRFAQRQALTILSEEGAKKVLLHSFTDSSKLMKQTLESNFFISVGMNLLRDEEVQKRIASFPLDHLLFETDSPIRFGEEKALPESVLLVAEKVAQLKNLPLAEAESAQEKNFRKLFGSK